MSEAYLCRVCRSTDPNHQWGDLEAAHRSALARHGTLDIATPESVPWNREAVARALYDEFDGVSDIGGPELPHGWYEAADRLYRALTGKDPSA